MLFGCLLIIIGWMHGQIEKYEMRKEKWRERTLKLTSDAK